MYDETKQILLNWLERNRVHGNYVGAPDDFEGICLDGWFNLLELVKEVQDTAELDQPTHRRIGGEDFDVRKLDQPTKELLQEAIFDPAIVKQAAVLGAEDQDKKYGETTNITSE